MQAVAGGGMPAVALTDHGNLFAMVKFYREAERSGVKPLIGADLWIEGGSERAEPALITLLAKDQAGFRNLTRGSCRAATSTARDAGVRCSRATGSIPEQRPDSWRCPARPREMSGAHCSRDGRSRPQRCSKAGKRCSATVFYLEVQRLGRPDDEALIAGVLAMVATRPAPVVATNDVRFLARDEFEAHEARVCIHGGHRLDDPDARTHTRPSST